MISRRFGSLVLATFAALSTAGAKAATFERITTDGGLGNIAFRHLKSNDAGDFVGITNSRVFAGSIAAKHVGQILALDNSSFVLSSSTTFNVNANSGTGVPTTTEVTVDIDVLSTRVDLNQNGDFVLASNTLLWVGNTRTGQVRQVASGGAFTDFQVVKINDAGQYAALSAQKVYGGKVEDQAATLLLDGSLGSFEITDLFANQNQVHGEVGQERLTLNAAGQFVAITRSTVYAGDLAAMTVSQVFQERAIGFQHASLNAAGHFVVVSDHDVFVGSF